MDQERRKFMIIIGSIGFAFLAIIVVAVLATTSITNPVRVVSSDPANNSHNFPSYKDVTLTFNTPMSPNTVNQVSLTPGLSGNVSLDNTGKVLTFHANAGFVADANYTLTIDKPTDAKGKVGRSYTLHFQPIFAEFSSLPAAEQQKQIAATDKTQRDFPFTQYLPYSELNFKITYVMNGQDQPVYHVTLNVIKMGADDTGYMPALAQAKAKADAWIRSKGFEPAALQPVYNPDPTTGVYTPE